LIIEDSPPKKDKKKVSLKFKKKKEFKNENERILPMTCLVTRFPLVDRVNHT